MGTFLQDIRYGLRTLAKNPGLTAVAVVALALGIGANTVIFSSVNAMLLRPFAFKDLDRAVAVWETIPRQDEDRISAAPANFRDWTEQSTAFDDLAASHGWDVNLTGSGLSERVEGVQVTRDFFALLGIAPQLGRAIAAGDFEPGRSSVVVLSYRFWQRHLGADRHVVGENLLLNGAKFTVVGIMPADFDYPVGADAWAPLEMTGAQAANRSDHYLQVIGRSKPGVSISQAQADLNAIAARLGQQYPGTNAGHGARVVGLVDDMTFGSKQFVLTLMGAAVFVLLLACANVANLHLARATARQKEIALRIALGAGRWRIARQLLVEGVLVATAGALCSLLLSSWGLELCRRSIPAFIVQHVPGLKHLEIDSRVLAFTLAIGVLSGIVASLAPSLQASRSDVNDVLKEGGRGGGSGPGRSRLRALLVVSEVALALVLLLGAGLMVKGFQTLIATDRGFDRYRVLSFHVALAESKYGDQASIRGFYDQVMMKLQALPGVQSAAGATSLPGSWNWDSTEYRGEDQPPAAPGELRSAISQSITPDFFRTLRIPLLKGRVITPQDGPDAAPVVVISERLARRIWPGQDPVGKRMKLGRERAHEAWRTVVGVVGDVKLSTFDPEPNPTVYVPFAQVPQASLTLAVRTSGDPVALAAAARASAQSIDPDQPAYDVRTLDQLLSDNDSGIEFSARMMMAFGAIALILAAGGIFAVMAYSVRQRTHEIGVRMALGAQRKDTLKLVLGYALKLSVAGLAIGVPCALVLTRALSSLLFGVIRIDPLIFAGFTVLLALIGALAAYVPARWATRVDPMEALRYE
ncbi:MAG TPA: ABC transporter permease [Terriglobia bacterium]